MRARAVALAPILTLALAGAALSGCGPAPTATPPPTATGTATATPTASTTPTPTVTPSPTFPRDALVAADRLNLRAGPNTLHPIRGGLGRGTPVAIDGRNDDGSWLAVRAEDGAAGWVHAGFVEARRDLVAVPVIPTPTSPPTPTPTPVPMDPALPLVVQPSEVAQGDPILVRLRAPDAAQVVAAFERTQAPLVPIGEGVFVGILGAAADLSPGQQPIYLTLIDAAGGVTNLAHSMVVRTAPRIDQAIRIDLERYPERGGGLDVAVREAERARLLPVWQTVTPERRWQGRWLAPITPTVTSPFGARRVFNDGAFASTHTGADFSAPAGAPVRAAAGGVVAVAEPLPILGNAVWIDHGWGVHSGYGHLSALRVAPGQAVAAGDAIGDVGATGAATGPHLHWEVRVHGVAVAPLAWLAADVGAVP